MPPERRDSDAALNEHIAGCDKNCGTPHEEFQRTREDYYKHKECNIGKFAKFNLFFIIIMALLSFLIGLSVNANLKIYNLMPSIAQAKEHVNQHPVRAKEVNSKFQQIAAIQTDVDHLKKDMSELKKDMKDGFKEIKSLIKDLKK